jgi:hypothetical protein
MNYLKITLFLALLVAQKVSSAQAADDTRTLGEEFFYTSPISLSTGHINLGGAKRLSDRVYLGVKATGFISAWEPAGDCLEESGDCYTSHAKGFEAGPQISYVLNRYQYLRSGIYYDNERRGPSVDEGDEAEGTLGMNSYDHVSGMEFEEMYFFTARVSKHLRFDLGAGLTHHDRSTTDYTNPGSDVTVYRTPNATGWEPTVELNLALATF